MVENILLILIKNKIRETNKSYNIPNSIFYYKFVNLLMTNFTNLSVKNNYIQPIQLSSILSSFIFYINFAQKI